MSQRLSRAVSDAFGGSSRRDTYLNEDRYRYEPRGREGGRDAGYDSYAYATPRDDYYSDGGDTPRVIRTNQDSPRSRTRESKYYYSPDDHSGRRRGASIFASPGPESSKTPDISDSSRNSRRQKSNHVIEDSRPPITSRTIPAAVYHQPIDVVYSQPPPPRRSDSISSRRSKSKSSPERPSRLDRLLGRSSSRNRSGEDVAKTERRSRSERPSRQVACVVCMEDVSSSKGSDLKCGHRMCNSCLKRIFRMSVKDPQHMPPRCCTQDHIPLKYVDRLFDTSFKSMWNDKFTEYTARNRLYCPARKCGEWIRPENIKREDGRKVGRCGRCKTKVCVKCGEKLHASSRCPKDDNTRQFLDQAAEEGWKRCYKCKAMVERKEGCNHMTCRCGAEFCIVCGEKWKGCDCPWFNNTAADADRLEHMNIPGRSAEAGGDGRYVNYAQTYGEEMRLRRLQELRDSVYARDVQQADFSAPDYNMMGGVGDITGIGNASGHFMNDNYRRERSATVTQPLPRRYMSTVERNSSHRGGSVLDQRPPPDRYGDISVSRGRRLSPTAPPLRPTVVPEPSPRRESYLRRPSMDDERYDSGLARARSERAIPYRSPRKYEDEPEPYTPRHRRVKSSAMAGLNGKERGQGRVAEWSNYVQPGLPEGESVLGHV